MAWGWCCSAASCAPTRVRRSSAPFRSTRRTPRRGCTWGCRYELLGNPAAAVDAYRKALSITPQRTETRQILDAALRRYKIQ